MHLWGQIPQSDSRMAEEYMEQLPEDGEKTIHRQQKIGRNADSQKHQDSCQLNCCLLKR